MGKESQIDPRPSEKQREGSLKQRDLIQRSKLCREYTSTDGWIFGEPAVMATTKDAGSYGEVRGQVSDIRNQV